MWIQITLGLLICVKKHKWIVFQVNLEPNLLWIVSKGENQNIDSDREIKMTGLKDQKLQECVWV